MLTLPSTRGILVIYHLNSALGVSSAEGGQETEHSIMPISYYGSVTQTWGTVQLVHAVILRAV